MCNELLVFDCAISQARLHLDMLATEQDTERISYHEEVVGLELRKAMVELVASLEYGPRIWRWYIPSRSSEKRELIRAFERCQTFQNESLRVDLQKRLEILRLPNYEMVQEADELYAANYTVASMQRNG
jgi:hypothetical protein